MLPEQTVSDALPRESIPWQSRSDKAQGSIRKLLRIDRRQVHVRGGGGVEIYDALLRGWRRHGGMMWIDLGGEQVAVQALLGVV